MRLESGRTRAAAWISGDRELIRIYEEGRDLYTEMASTITGVPLELVTKEQRQAAKPVSFGAIYGIGAVSLAQNAFADYNIEMSVAEAKTALDRFFQKFWQLDQWRKDNAERCIAEGMVRISCGRVVEASWEIDKRISFQQACNLLIQGVCADAMLRAIALTHRRLRRMCISGGLIASVHDETLLEVTEDQAEQAKDILHRSMVDAFELTFPGAPTLNVAEAVIGHSWAELKPS